MPIAKGLGRSTRTRPAHLSLWDCPHAHTAVAVSIFIKRCNTRGPGAGLVIRATQHHVIDACSSFCEGCAFAPNQATQHHVIAALPRACHQVRASPSTRRFTAPTGSPAAPRRRHRRCNAWLRAVERRSLRPWLGTTKPRSPGGPAERMDQAAPAHAPGRPSSRHGAAEQASRFVIPLALWSAPIDFPRATPQDAVDGPLAGWPRGSVRGVMAVRWPDGQRTFARMCCPRS